MKSKCIGNSIGERLTYAMSVRSVKQGELSRMTGIAQPMICEYQKNKYCPKQMQIYKICKALRINEAWLLGFDDVPMDRLPQIQDLYDQLNANGKQRLIAYAQALLDMQKDGGI